MLESALKFNAKSNKKKKKLKPIWNKQLEKVYESLAQKEDVLCSMR